LSEFSKNNNISITVGESNELEIRLFFFLRTQEEHVLDLQLLACRKKYRGRGLGRHLMKVKNVI
jgi:GNAT superfamily N-acetyltransferase